MAAERAVDEMGRQEVERPIDGGPPVLVMKWRLAPRTAIEAG